MNKKEEQDLKLSFDDLDSASGGLVVDRTPFASGIGVFDLVDDKTGRNVNGIHYEDLDEAREAARALGQSEEAISGSEWNQRFNR